METKRTLAGRGISVTACLMMMAASIDGNELAAEETRAVDQIQRYCTTSWRNARIAPADWADCTQEVFANLLGRVSRSGLVPAINDASSSERRELNRSIWCASQRWRRAPRLLSLNGEAYSTDPLESRTSDVDVEALEMAMAKLSGRQKYILEAWSEGGTIREIARELKIPQARVSDEKYKAIGKLRRLMAG